MLVAIAVLLGGNNTSQMKFHDYIVKDEENKFMQKIEEMLRDCFDAIKKSQSKRNEQQFKIDDVKNEFFEFVVDLLLLRLV